MSTGRQRQRPISPRQQAFLGVIREYLASSGGIPPTIREIAARSGIRSTNAVSEMLRRLERKGYLSPGEFNRARSIRLIGYSPPTPTEVARLLTEALAKLESARGLLLAIDALHLVVLEPLDLPARIRELEPPR